MNDPPPQRDCSAGEAEEIVVNIAMTDAGTPAVNQRETLAATPSEPVWLAWVLGALLGLLTACISFATLDEPGMTVDEPPNVLYGKKLVWTLEHAPESLTTPAGIDRMWRVGHEHPPLTRFLLGVSHGLLDLEPNDPSAIYPLLGRPTSALALALLVVLTTRLAWQIRGAWAGLAGGLVIPLMPRLFSHGQLASPEVITAACFLVALVAANWAFEERPADGPARRSARVFFAGIFCGAALLAKLSTVLLWIIVPLAVLWKSRGETTDSMASTSSGAQSRKFRSWILSRAPCIAWLALWWLTSVITLVAGWPWLWPVDLEGYAPGWMGTAERLYEYFAVGIDRATIYVWYFGRQYPNETSGVPWHFAWVYFFTTVPVGLQALGVFLGIPACLGAASRSLAARLTIAAVAVVLFFFTLPFDRYDGERLFLMVFAPWGVIVGVGVGKGTELLRRVLPRSLTVGLLTVFLFVQTIGLWRVFPFGLSYYSAAIGGLAGATRAGLEPTYWGDSLTSGLLNELAEQAKEGDRVALLPTLHPIHPQFLQTPALRAKQIQIVAGDRLETEDCEWALLFHRPGYLNDPLPLRVQNEGTVVAEVAREGVWLGRVYRLPKDFRSGH